MVDNIESLDRIDPTGLPVGATITLPGDAITRLLRHSGVAGGLLFAKEVDYPLSNDETIALELSADLGGIGWLKHRKRDMKTMLSVCFY